MHTCMFRAHDDLAGLHLACCIAMLHTCVVMDKHVDGWGKQWVVSSWVGGWVSDTSSAGL